MTTTTTIRSTMRRLIEGAAGSYDESNKLAEDAARELGHPEWIDDGDHDIWTMAAEVLDENVDDEETEDADDP